MSQNESDAFRLSTVHGWVSRRSKSFTQPSRFLEYYEDKVKAAKTIDPHNTVIDNSDPLRLAAEIEALAAWRRVQAWHTREGLTAASQRAR